MLHVRMPLLKAACVSLAALLLLGNCVTCLIIPEELPTILSLIYSNIPPIKKGTDSRLGIGFRLGEHADFQIIMELGPQKYTDPIKNDVESKKKRATMLYAAMKGDLGPWAQAVAKYQMEEKIKKVLENYKLSSEKLSKVKVNLNSSAKKNEGSDWLMKWSQGINPVDHSVVKHTTTEKILPNINRMRVIGSQINSDTRPNTSAQTDLIFLKKLFGKSVNETKSFK